MTGVRSIHTISASWLAWKRRSRTNRILFVLSLSLAAFVTLAFGWASLNTDPGNFARYYAFYWVWALCAVGVLLGMAEYKTSPLRKGREREHLFIVLYIGAHVDDPEIYRREPRRDSYMVRSRSCVRVLAGSWLPGCSLRNSCAAGFLARPP